MGQLAAGVLDGFAFGPSSAQGDSLPAGTTIYPNGSTISGNVGCGLNNNLSAVFTYSGPSGASVQVNFVSNTSKGGNTSARRQGKNSILLLAGPPNGAYEISGSAYENGRPNFLSFDDRLTLSRSC